MQTSMSNSANAKSWSLCLVFRSSTSEAWPTFWNNKT